MAKSCLIWCKFCSARADQFFNSTSHGQKAVLIEEAGIPCTEPLTCTHSSISTSHAAKSTSFECYMPLHCFAEYQQHVVKIIKGSVCSPHQDACTGSTCVHEDLPEYTVLMEKELPVLLKVNKQPSRPAMLASPMHGDQYHHRQSETFGNPAG